MVLSRLASVMFIVAVAAGATIFACGDDGNNPDAKQLDAKVFMDAPAGVSGLGQKCGSGLPACPTNAANCIGLRFSNGTTTNFYCTPFCDQNASAMTGSNGQFPTTASGYTPPPDVSICAGAYSGSVGTPGCGVPTSWTPMDSPPIANKNYTGINLACFVVCGAGSACPAGLTCTNTACTPI